MRPLLSITFPQGFRISKNIGHPTSGSGGKKTVKRYLKSEQTHLQTDGSTDRRTDISTYRKHRPRGLMLWQSVSRQLKRGGGLSITSDELTYRLTIYYTRMHYSLPLRPGRCWSDLYSSILEAERLVLVTGWSVCTSTRLVRDPGQQHLVSVWCLETLLLHALQLQIINRPGVAKAVLQKKMLLID